MSFPRMYARTRRFTLGVPHSFHLASDGDRVLFLRSPAGDDPNTCLWLFDLESGTERLVADPTRLAEVDTMSAVEKARRERLRQTAGGIVAFSCDDETRRAVFALAGQVYLADLRTGEVLPRELGVAGVAIDPKLDPTGTRIAYVADGSLRVRNLADGTDHAVAEPDADDVTWGLAEFIAAEEMGRHTGYWWSRDGATLLAARVDEAQVPTRYISDPANPDKPPAAVKYPAAGTTNAGVSLWLIGVDGARVEVAWDNETFEYLVAAGWPDRGPYAVVQTRDERTVRVLHIEPATGAAPVACEATDSHWVDIIPGVPAYIESNPAERLMVRTSDDADTRRLVVGNDVVTPPGLQVDRVFDVDGDTVLFAATDEPSEMHVWEYGPRGLVRLTDGRGVFAGRRSGGTTLISGQTLDGDGVTTRVLRGGEEMATIASRGDWPAFTPRVELLRAGHREIRTALVLPSEHRREDGPLPVLMDPYGGPHGQRVRAARRGYLEPQWLADQGFAVIIADGRGTPLRGPAWERSIRGDLLTFALEDQIAALTDVARHNQGLVDSARVAIRGWSFGGYLAAAAVLRHPDVFHAAIAGAPVTDQRLYDTHYKERYLGHPDEEPDNYERCSLIPDAPKLRRPLMLIHGLADDNVLVAHTLRLSSALLAAGRPHTVLPLSGVTHMTPQEKVAENLIRLQVEFLRQSLTDPAVR